MKNNTVRFYELFCYVRYISGNQACWIQLKLSLWLFFLTKLKNKRIQCSGTITKKFKDPVTLWLLVHTDYIYVCVCVSPVREWLRLSVLTEVHYLEERVHSWQQQTLDRLWLFAVWKQGNNNQLLLPFNNSWYENIKVLVKCFSKNKAVARSVVSLQGPISCNATVLMSETKAETKQVDCQIGEWGWINSASD